MCPPLVVLFGSGAIGGRRKRYVMALGGKHELQSAAVILLPLASKGIRVKIAVREDH